MKIYFLSIIIAISLSACTYELTPYTLSIAQQSQLNSEQLKAVQFYVSHDIILYRYLDNVSTEVVAGEIKMIDGRKAEEIIISAGTPGVVVGMEREHLFVSFDTDGSFLRFAPNRGYDGIYTLMAKDWDGRTGIVEYAGKNYYTSSTGSYAHLQVSVQQLDQSQTTSKTVGGRTVE